MSNYEEQLLECEEALREFKDAFYKELEPLIVLVLKPINKILVKIVEHLRRSKT